MFFFFSSRRRHTRFDCDWSSDVCSSDLVLTADITMETKRRALETGAKAFRTEPFDQVEVLLRTRNLLETRLLHQELARHNESLEEIVRERTQQLVQTEKLATMGSLLAGVAHELNNPLTVVIGQAHLLREGEAGGAPPHPRPQNHTPPPPRA